MIKIRDYDVSPANNNESAFENFINREEGHYIINLDAEATGTSANEGYINAMYISPPGELNMSLGSLDTSTYYDFSSSSPATPSTVNDSGNLINSSLQVQMMFKIVTRETDTSQVINSVNV